MRAEIDEVKSLRELFKVEVEKLGYMFIDTKETPTEFKGYIQENNDEAISSYKSKMGGFNFTICDYTKAKKYYVSLPKNLQITGIKSYAKRCVENYKMAVKSHLI